MKRLRQLLSRRPRASEGSSPQLDSQASAKGAARSSHRRNQQRRRLLSESLEQRQLLAGDVVSEETPSFSQHNPLHHYDVNEDRKLSVLDALVVINHLVDPDGEGESLDQPLDEDPFAGRRVDVNDDGKVSALDALTVINAIASGEDVEAVAEYYLSVRDESDNVLPSENGITEVGVGPENSFFLEVAVDDLRTGDDQLGFIVAFQDIDFSTNGLVKPVLREVQEFVISSNVIDATSGNLTITQEGGDGTSLVYSASELLNTSSSNLEDDLVDTFGLPANSIRVTGLGEFDEIDVETQFGYRVRWVDDASAMVDQPNFLFNHDFVLPSETVQIDPEYREPLVPELDEFGVPTGQMVINEDQKLLQYSLDTVTRQLSFPGFFEQNFYTFPVGQYSLDTGFDLIGGFSIFNSASGVGVWDVEWDPANNSGDRPPAFNWSEDFDIVRVEVFLEEELTQPLVASLDFVDEGLAANVPGGGDPTLLDQDMIIFGDNSRITLSTGPVTNNPPVLSETPLTFTRDDNEGVVSTGMDLLQGATDADDDDLSITGFQFTTSSDGVTRDGSNITVDTSVYDSLQVGDSVEVKATYQVFDGIVAVDQTVTITINGVNDDPVIDNEVIDSFGENDDPDPIDLLTGGFVSDLDSSTLTFSNLQIAGGNAGLALNGSLLEITPSAATSTPITATIDVSDGDGGTATLPVTITVVEANDPPVVSGPATGTTNEDETEASNNTFELLQNVTDDENDPLTVSDFTVTDGLADAVTGPAANSTTISVDPSLFNDLKGSESAEIVATYLISDGVNDPESQTITLTVEGRNDAPVVSETITVTVSENVPEFNELLLGRDPAITSDPDGDSLSVQNISLLSSNDQGTGVGANGITPDAANGLLTIDPGAYAALEDGETATFVFTYEIVDDGTNTDNLATTNTITINIEGDTPNRPPTSGIVEDSFFDDELPNQTVDLLSEADDLDGDDLSVSGVTLLSGNPIGISVSGNNLIVNPQAYNFLADGISEEISYSYTISDPEAGSVQTNATITITGRNDAPAFSAEIDGEVDENSVDDSNRFDALSGVTDPDTALANLNATAITTTSTRTAPISLDTATDELVVNRDAFDDLAQGETEDIIGTVTISDGDGASVDRPYTITVNGQNDAPTFEGAITAEIDENAIDDSNRVGGLLTDTADAEDDTLTVTGFSVTSGRDAALSLDNGELVVDLSAFDDLAVDTSEDLAGTFTISDGNGGTVDRPFTITINGENDVPVFDADITPNPVSEQDASFNIPLLVNVSDPEGTTVTLDSVNFLDGDASGLQRVGNDLQVDPSAYDGLNTGENATILVQAIYSDEDNGESERTFNVVINGFNDAPRINAAITNPDGRTEDQPSFSVDMLADVTDAESDVSELSIQDLTFASDNGDGVSINADGRNLDVDPSAYNYLAVGEEEEIIATVNIVDGDIVNDPDAQATPRTVTITITGVNDLPEFDGAVEDEFDQEQSGTVALLDDVTDPDSTDTLSVTAIDFPDESALSLVNNELVVTGGVYDELPAGDSLDLIGTATIFDGTDSVDRDVTITINGENDNPVIDQALDIPDFSEDDSAASKDLRFGASDPDDGDTLTVDSTPENFVVTNDPNSAVSLNADGFTLDIDPRAYDSLNQGDEQEITVSFDLIDGNGGKASRNVTFSINGANDAPEVPTLADVDYNEFETQQTISLLDGVTDIDSNADLSVDVTNVVNDPNVAVIVSGDQLFITPRSYRELEDGENQVITIEYEVSDGIADAITRSLTVTIIGQTIQPSVIQGSLWIDHVENIDAVLNDGAAPQYNGIHEDDEKGLGGITVRLLEVIDGVETEILTVATDKNGDYEIDNLFPGNYIVEYDIPDSVAYTGARRLEINNESEERVVYNGPSIQARGVSGVIRRLDLLTSTYISAGVIDTSQTGELGGGMFELNADGSLKLFILDDAFDAAFAEIALNDACDAALLTVIENDGDVLSVRLDSSRFIKTDDGLGVRILGDLADYQWLETIPTAWEAEFDQYRNAVDKALANL